MKTNGPITYAQLPPSYKDELTATVIWRNLIRLINYSYESSTPKFQRTLKGFYMANMRLTEDQASAKCETVRNQIHGYKGSKFGNENAKEIAVVMKLPQDCLLSPLPEKEVAYVFVICTTISANDLFDILTVSKKQNDVVDEVAILAGDSDLFLRLYGTRKEIGDFVRNELSNNRIAPIQRTTTYLSFINEPWQRYPAQSHQDRKPSRPSWLPEDWKNMPETG